MNSYTFHITLYDVAFFGMTFIGLTFALQLWFAQSVNRAGNRYLALALLTMILWMVRVLITDVRLETLSPSWDRLPMQFLLALGPLIYFYVLKITRPGHNFSYKDILHFSPLVVELGVQALEIRESIATEGATSNTPAFQLLNPVLQLLIFISIIAYVYRSDKLIQNFYRRLPPTLMDRSLLEFRWLHRLLAATALLWLLWICFAAVDYFGYRNQLGIHVYYPFYIFFAVIIIWTAAAAFLKPQAGLMAQQRAAARPPLPSGLKEKGAWLKKAMETDRYYQDPELSLALLAGKLELPARELSQIINTALNKSFNDFINEYRIRYVISKMHDPEYKHITLLGIAYESGFNSKATFNRTFKQTTGKTPLAYKASIEKEVSFHDLRRHSRYAAIVSNHETTHKWSEEKLNRNYMFRNYIKTAVRNLKKNLGFTAINVLGLSVGLAICLLIVFYVADELSYDKYNTKADRIYRVTVDAMLNGHGGKYATSEGPLEAALKDNFPEIEKVTRIIDKRGLAVSASKFNIRKGNSNIEEKRVVYTESSLFDVFTLPMVSGNPKHSLDDPHTAVITESAAQKYFGKTDAVGQVLTINDTSQYRVTGVIKDIPLQSHFNYDFFLSFSSLPESHWKGWGYSGVHNYLLLRPGANIKSLESRIAQLEIKNSPVQPGVWTTGGNYLKTELTPLLDIHLKSNAELELDKGGSMQYVYIFSFIATIILLIACVNFMNLSTARSSNRAKEVGVRKVLGSARGNLIAQFLTESTLVTLISAFIAIGLAVLLLPLFNQVAGKQLGFTFHSLTWLAPSLIAIVLVVGFLAGSYPALYLSGFQPIQVLKGKLSAGFKNSILRNSLVVFQFGISIMLIICTLVIYNQLNYIHNKNLGFDRDQVLVIKNTAVLGKQAESLRKEIRQMPGVVNATMSLYQPTGDDRMKTGLFPDKEIDVKKDILSEFWSVDEDYINTMGLKLVAGRNFSKQMASDTSAVIVNEAFVQKFGQKDPLNKFVYRNSYGVQQFHIIGVVKNFNFESLRDKISPLVLVYSPDNGAISVKVKTADLAGLVSKIEDKWKQFSPNQQFSYSFMDQDFDATYRSEQKLGTLFISFSTLAILIACLGLFGLAAYAAEQRTKEIGIRKVLGASVSGIVGMLSIDFIRLVFISMLMASPLAWYFMNRWLQDFAYRTEFHWWILAVAGAVATLIAFVTISFQSIKAALANPVKSLRSE
ncbi:MAG: ABC transporter permease [Bacteroidetes bacterium]|nr:ABC transporter permease [Bacteroidota bacterium]